MIGYKATTNSKCKDLLYEVGQTYTLNGKMKICKRGFHFCQDLYDVFYYYPENKNIKVFKVEALGKIETVYDKSVTDKIMILEEVDLSNMVIEKNNMKKCFDGKGNLIKEEGSSGFWIKYEYDENRNHIKCENSDGYCVKYDYDLNNNFINAKYGKG
ncbi:hypothetical protein M0P65_05370 [Candidatus Gracilibacteria bacterium]|nr:hypothetical protein [Candidatus Gracilibacteria bacterium]